MTQAQAKEELTGELQENGNLYGGMSYMEYTFGEDSVILDGSFYPDTLEALAVYIRAARGQRP